MDHSKGVRMQLLFCMLAERHKASCAPYRSSNCWQVQEQ